MDKRNDAPLSKSDDEWYERERTAFIAWWESDGQKTFSETPTLAAGAGWLARAEAVRSDKAAIKLEHYINAAAISGADMPNVVVEKLQRAINNAAPQEVAGEPISRDYGDTGSSPAVAAPLDRQSFEKWLDETMGLQSEWQPDRNCYKEFAAHLAWKAWNAALRSDTNRTDAPQGGQASGRTDSQESPAGELAGASASCVVVPHVNQLKEFVCGATGSASVIWGDDRLVENFRAMLSAYKP